MGVVFARVGILRVIRVRALFLWLLRVRVLFSLIVRVRVLFAHGSPRNPGLLRATLRRFRGGPFRTLVAAKDVPFWHRFRPSPGRR